MRVKFVPNDYILVLTSYSDRKFNRLINSLGYEFPLYNANTLIGKFMLEGVKKTTIDLVKDFFLDKVSFNNINKSSDDRVGRVIILLFKKC